MKKLFYIIFVSLLLTACQKTIDCISSAGEKVNYEYSLNDFDTLVVNNDFEIHFIQDTVNEMIIFAYKKYADAVSYEIRNNCLVLDNSYSCKFTKPKKNNVRIDLHVKNLSLARINYPAKLISENTLLNDNEIGVIVNTKFCEANLDVNCRVFYFWNTHLNGGKMYLKGNSEFLKLWNASLFSVDASKLETNYAFTNNNSKADIYINVNKELNCTIRSSGNVYYTGNPSKIIVNDSLSSGKLIKLND